MLALDAAQKAGPAGNVLGIDVSQGMPAEARRRAAEAGLRSIEFVPADAEQLAFPHHSFDFIFSAPAVVFISDIPRPLRRWFDFLKPHGMVAFDAPAKPFGISQTIAEITAAHVFIQLANSRTVAPGKAIAFWDERLDHPAWQALRQAQPATREAMRCKYVDSVTARAVDGRVPNETAVNLAFGRKGG
jgi:ubiquinone/menaquinone biosynthesis C-methylase UbiE